MNEPVNADRDAAGRWRGLAARWRLAAFAAGATVLLHLLALQALRRGLDEPWAEGVGRLEPVRVSLVPAPATPAHEPAPAASPPPQGVPPASAPAAPPASSPSAAARLLAEADPSPEAAAIAEDDERPLPGSGMAADARAAPGSPEEPAPAARGTVPDASPDGVPPGGTAAERLAAAPGTAEAAGPLYGAALPAPVPSRRRFQVHYGDYAEGNVVAELDYALEVEQDRYRLRTEARAVGLTALFWSGALTQASAGRLGVDGLEPERYVEQRGRRPERRTSIDRATGIAVFPAGERAPLVAGVQDRLSMLIQLGLIARAQPQRMAAGRRIEVPELGSRAISPAVFMSRGDESLATDRGPLRTLHLERRDGDPARDPRVDVWLGYDHGLMPVRIRLTDPGGRVLDQVLVP